MRVWSVSSPGPVEQRPLVAAERPLPAPAAGQVLLRVQTCGVCRTDLHVAEGDLPVRRAGIVPGHQIVARVERIGDGVTSLAPGERVGVAWLHRTCGTCRFCRRGDENLCLAPDFTGWTVDGGFGELVLAEAAFCYRIPAAFSDVAAAPLLCAGVIGFRCLRQTRLGARDWQGARLGIYGFGAAGHVAIQIARARGADVYVCTRDRERHQALAAELGAAWTGGAAEAPPVALDAAIIFAPAGELVPAALRHLDRGGRLVLGGIHMSNLPSFPYEILYHERSVCSVANNTRRDAIEFLDEAARSRVTTHVETFPLDRVNEALRRLKEDAIRGAAVLTVSDSPSA